MYIHYICQWDWGKRLKRIGRQGPTAERMRTLAGRERMPSVSIWWRRDRSAGGKLPEREWVIILKRESISCRKSIVAIYPSARAFISKAALRCRLASLRGAATVSKFQQRCHSQTIEEGSDVDISRLQLLPVDSEGQISWQQNTPRLFCTSTTKKSFLRVGAISASNSHS